MADSEYPTEEELQKIEKWEGTIGELIEYVLELWHWPEYAEKIEGIEEINLQLHTGGWSGNESIIASLEENYIFWMAGWSMSRRGGHYYFKFSTNQLDWNLGKK